MNPYSKISFPVYRKYKNDKAWFMITGPDSFEEVQVIGSRWIRTEHIVHTLPERNFIYDLVLDYAGFADEIGAAEFERIARFSR